MKHGRRQHPGELPGAPSGARRPAQQPRHGRRGCRGALRRAEWSRGWFAGHAQSASMGWGTGRKAGGLGCGRATSRRTENRRTTRAGARPELRGRGEGPQFGWRISLLRREGQRHASLRHLIANTRSEARRSARERRRWKPSARDPSVHAEQASSADRGRPLVHLFVTRVYLSGAPDDGRGHYEFGYRPGRGRPEGVARDDSRSCADRRGPRRRKRRLWLPRPLVRSVIRKKSRRTASARLTHPIRTPLFTPAHGIRGGSEGIRRAGWGGWRHVVAA